MEVEEMEVSLNDQSTGMDNIVNAFIRSFNALVNTDIRINNELAAAEPPLANQELDVNRGAYTIKCNVQSGHPSEALGRIGNTIKSWTAHAVELREAIGDNRTSAQMVAAFNSMKNKCFNVKDVITGGSRKRRQSKKRKNHKNHNNNNQ